MKDLLRSICVLHLLALVFGDGYGQDVQNPANARILDYQFDNIGTGPYRFAFSTSDGTQRIEEGNLINPNTENEALVVSGSFSYVGPDGVTYSVKYTADENGFHPEGDHIKVPPFVPWTKHQHGDEHGEHTGHYQHTTEPQRPVYLPVEPARPLRPFRPIRPLDQQGPDPNSFFGQVSTPRPVAPQFIFPQGQRPLIGPQGLKPAFTQIASTTIKPQPIINGEPTKLTYLPIRRDIQKDDNEDDDGDDNSSPQSSNIASSILEILSAASGDDKGEKGSTSVKAEDVNAL